MSNLKAAIDAAHEKTERLGNLGEIDYSPELKTLGLLALIDVLEDGLNIVKETNEGRPEPYPGAMMDIVKGSLQAIESGKKTGLLKGGRRNG